MVERVRSDGQHEEPAEDPSTARRHHLRSRALPALAVDGPLRCRVVDAYQAIAWVTRLRGSELVACGGVVSSACADAAGYGMLKIPAR